MSDPKQIEQELRIFLANEDNIAKSDRLEYLMAIVNKQFALDKIDHLVIYYDLNDIIGRAKTAYAKTSLPMNISKHDVRDQEANYVLVLETFIGYLNKHKVLKRLVKFDHRR
jgi:hypothetical protein